MVSNTLAGHVTKYKLTLWPQQAAHSHDCQCVCSHQIWLSIASLHSRLSGLCLQVSNNTSLYLHKHQRFETMAFITSPTWQAVGQPLCMMPLHSSHVCLQWLQQVTDVVVRLVEGASCTSHARLNLLNHAVAFLAAIKSAHPQVLLVFLCHSNAAVIAYTLHQS